MANKNVDMTYPNPTRLFILGGKNNTRIKHIKVSFNIQFDLVLYPFNVTKNNKYTINLYVTKICKSK